MSFEIGVQGKVMVPSQLHLCINYKKNQITHIVVREGLNMSHQYSVAQRDVSNCQTMKLKMTSTNCSSRTQKKPTYSGKILEHIIAFSLLHNLELSLIKTWYLSGKEFTVSRRKIRYIMIYHR